MGVNSEKLVSTSVLLSAWHLHGKSPRLNPNNRQAMNIDHSISKLKHGKSRSWCCLRRWRNMTSAASLRMFCAVAALLLAPQPWFKSFHNHSTSLMTSIRDVSCRCLSRNRVSINYGVKRWNFGAYIFAWWNLDREYFVGRFAQRIHTSTSIQVILRLESYF